ncbi:isochorismatase family protein [Haliea sp. AH-315-K21]|uniref:Pyrimidine utilization protein B n=1 Tax=SAR86 cluster bacterium TaxID=2030880 RepID=A0A2A5CIV0_9GAMM|nr:isochorismatase family protein [Haliea sp. AH-315-K21]MBN4075906.1 isochorismatase family protein [Gammaproteobacteria bacterium AH-315-E17]PCJ43448.1 MAG: pyrimidine utilization protein B [SAR86 cluster bacterium]
MTTLNAQPENIDIDLKRSAIIVVDMQNAFAKPGGMLDLTGADISAAASIIQVNQKLLIAARHADVEVIYLAMTYKADLSDAGGPTSPNYHKELGMKLMREQPEYAGKVLIDGSWDWQIVDELKPQAGEIIIRKPRYSGFVSTNLDNYLRSKDIRYLFLTGIATNVCVESTGRDAFFAEYWPILIEDAVNHTGPDFCGEATRWNFENIFGWVTESESVLTALEQK